MWCVHVSAHIATASPNMSACMMITSRSLGIRSANKPAGSDSTRMGMEPIAATSPTRKALFESSSASQPCAIDCIQVPMSDSVCPVQKSR